MFDRLIDLLLQFIDKFAFLCIVQDFERVVVLRLGRYNRTLEPGLHPMWPLAEEAYTENIVPRTYDLNAQSLTTVDNKCVVVSGVVTARVSDVRKAVLEVEHVEDAVKDACVAEIGDAVRSVTWETLQTPAFQERLTKVCRARAFRWGIEIMRIQLSDVAPSRAIRLFHDYGRAKV